ncbi:MAG: metallophosphoesterase family protein [Anaerolineales bacterium]|nr:metallophosphoesterase family protein [Anaerolineales bacterium]
MIILVISDIHANLAALETVLKDAGEVDAVWCLGDVVGYGPNPNECIELIREQPNLVCLTGNHDAACYGLINPITFNYDARLAVEWTQSVLTGDNLEFLRTRPQSVEIENVTLAHGSPRHPVLEYLLDTQSALENMDYFTTDYCLIGHSHIPLMFYQEDPEGDVRLLFPPPGLTQQLKPRAILNPGSVGQPRDRDRRASYALFDPEFETWAIKRVEYDIRATQEDMRAVDLPSRHIDRLSGGW